MVVRTKRMDSEETRNARDAREETRRRGMRVVFAAVYGDAGAVGRSGAVGVGSGTGLLFRRVNKTAKPAIAAATSPARV